MRPRSSQQIEIPICKLSPNTQKHSSRSQRYWQIDEAVVRRKRLMSQPQRMVVSCFEFQNGKLITPLLLFYLHLGLVCTKNYCFVEYTPKKCFNKFVQSAVDARRQRDDNPNSSVVAETMKLLANKQTAPMLIK